MHCYGKAENLYHSAAMQAALRLYIPNRECSREGFCPSSDGRPGQLPLYGKTETGDRK